MKQGRVNGKNLAKAGAAVLAFLLVLIAGCRHNAGRTDQQLTTAIQAKIQAEPALAGQNIQVGVTQGIATLSGNVSDEASRTLAAYDSGSINGVKTVVNNLTVQAAPAPEAQAAPAQAAEAQAALPKAASASPAPAARRPRRETPPRAEQAEATPLPPPPPQPVEQPAPQPLPLPAPPPQPVIREVTLPAGTVIQVRITEALDSKTTQPNDVFHGSVATDLTAEGVVAIPHDSPVMGRVVDAKDAAHFKGNALLSIELTQVNARGQKIALVTDSYSKTGTGRGKNTAEKAGGGALFGAIIGALAGGGKGAAIGTLAGDAAGTRVNAATRGQQVKIPSETLINFQLQSPITLRVRIPPGGEQPDQSNQPQLQPRSSSSGPE